MSELQRLRDRVEELEDILGVTSSLPKRLFPQMVFKPKDNERLLGMLLARTFLSQDAIYYALFGTRLESDQPQIKHAYPVDTCSTFL